MGRKIALAVLLICLVLQGAEFRENRRVTVAAAGTPIQISASRLMVRSLMIQMRSAWTGTVWILSAAPGVTPAVANGTDEVGHLNSDDAVYSDCICGTPGKRIDLQELWIDASVNGTAVSITYLKE